MIWIISRTPGLRRHSRLGLEEHPGPTTTSSSKVQSLGRDSGNSIRKEKRKKEEKKKTKAARPGNPVYRGCSHNHLSCTSITKSHMYYHELLAFTRTRKKGKATGDAGSIPACESKKTEHQFPGLSILRYFTDASIRILLLHANPRDSRGLRLFLFSVQQLFILLGKTPAGTVLLFCAGEFLLSVSVIYVN